MTWNVTHTEANDPNNGPQDQMQLLASKVKGWSWCEVGLAVGARVGVRRVTLVIPREATSSKVSLFL